MAWPGKVVKRSGSLEYKIARYQYASTSVASAQIEPAMIIYVSNKDDISKALRKASSEKIKVAIRTGGHQYCGASSTYGNNIQLDLSQAFKECVVTGSQVYVGVSVLLMDLIATLRRNGLFVPTGCCGHVHVGGHCQSGGYGILTRSFGLFSDHIVELHVVMANGDQRVITKADKDLWFAILGGSPGNYVVVTHIVLHVRRDSDYPDSRALVIYDYSLNENTTQQALDLLINPSTIAPDSDIFFTLASSNIIPPLTEDALLSSPGDVNTQVYAITVTWMGRSPYTSETERWFENIKAIFKRGTVYVDYKTHTPVSTIIAKSVLLTRSREFDRPYIKRLRGSNKIQPEWSAYKASQIHKSLSMPGVHVALQYQYVGGLGTGYRLNDTDRSCAHSFRDDTVALVATDLFYDGEAAKAHVEACHNEEDKSILFSPTDRRYWWGSYESSVKPTSWTNYYDTRAVVDRLVAIKKRHDPNDVLTPNRFTILHLADC